MADLDRRLAQIDRAIEEAAKRGKTNTALSAMEGQRRARAGLTSERNEAAATPLAALKAERATVAGRSTGNSGAPQVADDFGAPRKSGSHLLRLELLPIRLLVAYFCSISPRRFDAISASARRCGGDRSGYGSSDG